MFSSYSKTVHLSIDDVGFSLRWLAQNKPESIFDMRFFGKLREWHDTYDAKFSLYCVTNTNDFSFVDIPKEYFAEFYNSSDWLKFGYHGNNLMTPFAQTNNYKNDFVVLQNFMRGTKMATATALRLHYWLATPEQKQFLLSQGVRYLLYPNDDNLPYDNADSFEDCGLLHIRTNVRFEHINEINEETLGMDKDRIVAFTHEQYFDSEFEKIEQSLNLFANNKYMFVF